MPQSSTQHPHPRPPALPTADASDAPLTPSKTQRKRDAHALQTLGIQLVALSIAQLARLALPEALTEAVVAAHGCARTARGHGRCSISASSCGSSSPACSVVSARHWRPDGLSPRGPSPSTGRHRSTLAA